MCRLGVNAYISGLTNDGNEIKLNWLDAGKETR